MTTTTMPDAHDRRHDPRWALETDRQALESQVRLCRREQTRWGALVALAARARAFAVPRVVSLVGLSLLALLVARALMR